MSTQVFTSLLTVVVALGCLVSVTHSRPMDPFRRESRRRCCFVDLFCSVACNRWGANPYSKRTSDQTSSHPVIFNDLLWAAEYLDEMNKRLQEVQEIAEELQDKSVI